MAASASACQEKIRVKRTKNVSLLGSIIRKRRSIDSVSAYSSDSESELESVRTEEICSRLLELEQDPLRTYFTRVRPGEGLYRGEIDWKQRREGRGVMVWEEGGGVYRGEWKKDNMHGQRVMLWRESGTLHRGA